MQVIRFEWKHFITEVAQAGSEKIVETLSSSEIRADDKVKANAR